MLWAITYCILASALFWTGKRTLGLHWFLNGLFALLGASALAFGAYKVVTLRGCLRAVMKAALEEAQIPSIKKCLRKAFGAGCNPRDDTWEGGLIAAASIPFVIILIRLASLLGVSPLWSVLIGVFVGILAAAGLSRFFGLLAGQTKIYKAVQAFLESEYPAVWEGLDHSIREERGNRLKAARLEKHREFERKEAKWAEIRQKDHRGQRRREAKPGVIIGKIRYVLILLEREPVGGKDFFIEQILDSLYSEGKPYRQYVDKETKIALEVVGPQDFKNEQFRIMSALFHFSRIWGYTPDREALLAMRFQILSGRGGSGVTIEEWK